MNKIQIVLDNVDNDKKMTIKLPIVPRIGDWISIENDNVFSDEILLTVTHVILAPNEITVTVTGKD